MNKHAKLMVRDVNHITLEHLVVRNSANMESVMPSVALFNSATEAPDSLSASKIWVRNVSPVVDRRIPLMRVTATFLVPGAAADPDHYENHACRAQLKISH